MLLGQGGRGQGGGGHEGGQDLGGCVVRADVRRLVRLCGHVEEGGGHHQGDEALSLAGGHRHHHLALAVAPVGAQQAVDGGPEGVVLLHHVGGGVMDHELAIDAGDVDQDLVVLVGDHAPRVALVGGAVDHADMDTVRRQPVGQLRQPCALAGGPAPGVGAERERDDVAHRRGAVLQVPKARCASGKIWAASPNSSRFSSGS